MSFPTYPAYKDSGVEWLGEVPEHWGVSPLKWLAEQVTDKATTSEFQVGLENIEGWAGRFIETDTEFAGDGIAFRQEDILFGKLRPYLAKVWLADRPGQAVGDFFVLRPCAVNSEFLHKYILTPAVIENLNASTIGAKMPRVGWEDMAALVVTLPPDKEQSQIARFLDHETARIDALIAEQQRLIELLKEKRQAVISHAVTKGLNPEAPMKDSGVEWLGEVPAHWDVIQLGRVCRKVSDGPHFSPSYVDEGVMFLSARNIAADAWYLDDAKYVSEDDYNDFCRRVIPEKGDVLYTKGGTTGVARVVDLDERFQVWVHVAVLKLHQSMADPYYVAFSLNSSGCYEQSQLYTRGATNQDLGLTRMVKIWLALPSREEQLQIRNFLAEEVGKLDRLIVEVIEVVELLKERRSALISAAVTGKIDVRGWQPPADTGSASTRGVI